MACKLIYDGTQDDGTQVYDASSPTSWTELDLSGIVGANRALVYLQVDNVDASTYTWFRFRTKGLGRNIACRGEDSSAICAGMIYYGNTDYFLVETDDTGKVEWITDSAVDTDIYLLSTDICPSAAARFPPGLSPGAMKMVIDDGC